MSERYVRVKVEETFLVVALVRILEALLPLTTYPVAIVAAVVARQRVCV